MDPSMGKRNLIKRMVSKHNSIINTKRCIKCSEIIPDDAKVCSRCLSSQLTKGKVVSSLKTISSMFAAWATAIALFILIWSNYQTQDAIQLQEEALTRTDSTLTLVVKQIELMREANSLQFEQKQLQEISYKEEVKKFIEERKPVLDISKIDCKRDSNIAILYCNIYNKGISSATNIDCSIIIKDSSKVYKRRQLQIKHRVLTANLSRIVPIEIKPINNSVIRVNLSYSWDIYNIKDSLEKYFVIRFHDDDSTCSCYVLDELEVKTYWGE